MTDYLSGVETTAHVAGIRLICKHLLVSGPQTRDDIAVALNPVGMADPTRTILEASLSVAADLGILQRPGGKADPWLLVEGVVNIEQATSADDFQALLLRRIGAAAVSAIEEGRPPSDVARGLAWLIQRDPLTPLSYEFAGSTEETLKRTKMLEVIPQPTQWNAFRRWTIDLGVANRMPSAKGERLLVTTVRAIRAGATADKKAAPANLFLDHLIATVPILGDPVLLATLPEPARPNMESRVSAALAQGLIALAEDNWLVMESGEDSARSVALSVGAEGARSIRTIRRPPVGTTS